MWWRTLGKNVSSPAKEPSSDTERNDPPRPIGEHLSELRWRVIAIICTVAAATAAAWWQYALLLGIVERPLRQAAARLGIAATLQTFSPAEAFVFVMKIGVIAGLVFSSPMILYQLWAFVEPGLTRRERGVLMPVFVLGLFFFLAGAALAYFWVAPAALYYLSLVARNVGVLYNLRLSEYTEFLVDLMLAFGAAFELPLVMLGLSAGGIAAPSAFARPWRLVVVGAFVIGAILTPPDVISQIVMAAVLIGLYCLGIAFAKIGWKRSSRSALDKEPKK